MATLTDLIERFAATQSSLRVAACRNQPPAAIESATDAHMTARRNLFERLGMVCALKDHLLAYDQNIDAPGGDHSRAQPPTGDDYKNILGAVQSTLSALIGESSPALEETT